MTTYYAVVRFNTVEFDADNEDEAEGRLQDMIDQLGRVDTTLAWDDVDWIMYEESGD